MAHFTGITDVSPAICLKIKADDLHSAHLTDAFRQQVDFGANQVRDLECLLTRQNPAVLVRRNGALSGIITRFDVLAYLTGGVPAARRSVRALIVRRKLSISFLMVLAAVAAALVGEIRDGAILLFLYSLAETLEGYAMGNTKRAVASLMQLRPETANVVDGSDSKVVPVESVLVGQKIVVKPGERIPLDGVLLAGSGAVDQSPITGESVPVDKVPGDEVFAGSVNGHAGLTVEVSKDASSSTLARMIHLVTVAQSQRSPSQRFSDWFGQRYTFVVLIGAVVALGMFFIVGLPSREAFYKAATLLVVANPCAIVISVPAAVLSALARAARLGVLFKGGAAIETFGAVDTLALDKTGTLTEAKMKVVDIKPFGLTESALLALAGAIESASEHPVAVAIRKAAEEGQQAGLTAGHAASELRAVPGKGVTAVVADRAYWAGNSKLAAELGISLDAAVSEAVARFEAGGRTVVLVGNRGRDGVASVGAGGGTDAPPDGGSAAGNGAVLGVIAVADTLRTDAPAMVERLHAAGVGKVVMLTGDVEQVARAIGAATGIDEVRAGLLPEDKLEAVADLQGEGRTVAMVGDGVNDAPALATADIGVAMGAAGSAVAVETADIALMGDNLLKLPEAISLAKRTVANMRQNIVVALATVSLLVVGVLFGGVTMAIGMLVHEASVLVVIVNAMRLLRRKPGARPSAPRPAAEPIPALSAG